MLQFNCPFCGMRDQSEFTYGRERAPVPALAAGQDAWQRYVYERENPCGLHTELWHHNNGCRQWLEIVRDTMTHEVLSVQPARASGGPAAPASHAIVAPSADATGTAEPQP